MIPWAIQARALSVQGGLGFWARSDGRESKAEKNEKVQEYFPFCRILKLSHSGQVRCISAGDTGHRLRKGRPNPQNRGFAFTEVKVLFHFIALRSGIIYGFLYPLVFRFFK